MFDENAKMAMVDDRPTQAVRNLNPIIEDISKKFINEYDVEEQKQILTGVKNTITSHYEELRQNHLKGAEDYGRRIEMLQA